MLIDFFSEMNIKFCFKNTRELKEIDFIEIGI